jgi:hypothetical protein
MEDLISASLQAIYVPFVKLAACTTENFRIALHSSSGFNPSVLVSWRQVSEEQSGPGDLEPPPLHQNLPRACCDSQARYCDISTTPSQSNTKRNLTCMDPLPAKCPWLSWWLSTQQHHYPTKRLDPSPQPHALGLRMAAPPSASPTATA